MKKDQWVAAMSVALEPHLDPGETVRAVADVRSGSGLIVGVFGKFAQRRCLALTDKRLIVLELRKWRGEPVGLHSADLLASLTLEKFSKRNLMLRLRRSNGEELRFWAIAFRWKNEMEQIASALENATRAP